MIISNRCSAFVFSSHRKILSLVLLIMLAAVGIPSAALANTALFDRNGFELDGAGAAENSVPLEATAITLLTIGSTLGLGMLTIVSTDRRVRQKKLPGAE